MFDLDARATLTCRAIGTQRRSPEDVRGETLYELRDDVTCAGDWCWRIR